LPPITKILADLITLKLYFSQSDSLMLKYSNCLMRIGSISPVKQEVKIEGMVCAKPAPIQSVASKRFPNMNICYQCHSPRMPWIHDSYRDLLRSFTRNIPIAIADQALDLLQRFWGNAKSANIKIRSISEFLK
jgi:hypothetical protein